MGWFERYLCVGLGSAFGGCARYWLGGVVTRWLGGSFPWGTFAVNVVGSFVLGFFLTLALERTALDPRLRLLVAVGFCGGFTTFSTFAWESERLLGDGSLTLALGNVAGSVVAGVLAVVGGAACARWLGG